jgi:signal transduction histidine kinase
MQYPQQSAKIQQQITEILLTTLESPILLARIAKILGETFQVDFCLIVAGVKPTARTEIALWCADDYPTIPPTQQTNLLEHLTGTANLASLEPLAIYDLEASQTPLSFDWPWQMLPARAILRIHTRFQSAANGVIVLGRSHPHQWTIMETEQLSLVSQTVAIAISHAQLTLQVLAANRHQTLLNQLNLMNSSTHELDEILQTTLAATAQALIVDRAQLLLLKYTDPLFKSRPTKQLPKTKVTVAYEWIESSQNSSQEASQTVSKLLNQSFWISESPLCQQAWLSAPQLTIIAQLPDEPQLDFAQKQNSIFDQEMKPLTVIVPLVGCHNHGSGVATVLGFLVLQHNQPHNWQADELEVIKWVSDRLSTTIIENQSLRQVQSLVEERTAQLQQSLQVQAKLYKKTRQQIKQLQELNQLKDDFLSTMSHELRTPLTNMSLAIRMLRQPNLPTEKQERYLSILEQEWNRENELIQNLLDLQRLEADQSQLQLQKIDLISFIKELAQSFQYKWTDKKLSLKFYCALQSLIFQTEPDSLNRILQELLTNAGKYSHPETTVFIEITKQLNESENKVLIRVSNTGVGISADDLKHIFEKFRRGQGVTKKAVKGTGLGLALVKCLVQHLNGTIEVTSSPSEDSQSYLTSFTLSLPQLLG